MSGKLKEAVECLEEWFAMMRAEHEAEMQESEDEQDDDMIREQRKLLAAWSLVLAALEHSNVGGV